MDNKLFLTIIILTFIDLYYLTFMKHFFNHQIKLIQNIDIQINYLSATLCYIILIFGLYYFIIKNNKPIFDAFILGFLIYGVFEFTNKALFNKWKWITVLIDSLWGGFLFAITTFLVYSIGKIKK